MSLMHNPLIIYNNAHFVCLGQKHDICDNLSLPPILEVVEDVLLAYG